jgi:hypothetical protein
LRNTATIPQVSRNVDTFILAGLIHSDFEFSQDPVKSLHYTLIPSSVLLHAKQKPMQHSVVAWQQSMFFEDFFVCVEKRARGAVRRGGSAVDYGVEELDGCTNVSGHPSMLVYRQAILKHTWVGGGKATFIR